MNLPTTLIVGGYEIDLVAPCETSCHLLHPAAAAAVQAGWKAGARFHLGPVLNRLQRTADGVEAHLSDGEVITAPTCGPRHRLRPVSTSPRRRRLQTNRGIMWIATSDLHANIYALATAPKSTA